MLKYVRLNTFFFNPREDAGGLSREYGNIVEKTKGAPLYSHGRWYGVKQ